MKNEFEKRLNQAFNCGGLDRLDFMILFENSLEYFARSQDYIFITTELRIIACIFETDYFMEYSNIQFLEDYIKPKMDFKTITQPA